MEKIFGYLLLVSCGLMFSCQDKETSESTNPYRGLSVELKEIIRTIVPADGTVTTWKSISVAKVSEGELQWQGFTLTLTSGSHNEKFVIKYTSRLPIAIERNQRYKRVWPLGGQLHIIGEEVENSFGVARYTETTNGMIGDAYFTSGKILILEEGKKN